MASSTSELDMTMIENPHEVLLQKAKEIGVTNLNDPQFATQMDNQDPLHSFRSRFLIPKVENTTQEFHYFTGNSLGLQPKTTKKYVEEELSVWENVGVEGHFKHPHNRPWLTTDEYVLEQMSKIVGGQKEEVVIMNSLSVNLHMMMVPFYQPTQERYKIIIEAKAFPSDLYAVQCQAKFHGFDPNTAIIQIYSREGELTLRTEDILKCIEENGDSVALILFSGVQYYTGQFFEMEKITQAGHKKGCRVGFDLAHAVGNVILKLHDWDVDFACWCSYKYLNGGPGTIGGAFVHSKHATNFELPRFGAWWAHNLKTRFQMDEPQFDPIPGAFGFRCSNPPVLCIAALLASVEIFDNAGMPKLRNKSVLLTGYLEYLIKQEIGKDKLSIITPSAPGQRGCQLSLLFNTDVSPIHDKLFAQGILCDVRKPNVIRVSPTPLYNTFTDVLAFVNALKNILV